MVADAVSTGVSVHAATVAMFEVGIRGTAPGILADAVEETCRDLPESARRHDDILVSMVVALSSVVSVEAAGRRGYQTAVRAAERTCRNAAADRILETICGKTFETVYGALAACAYASNGRVFESGYEDALASVCGVEPGENPADMPAGLSPEDMDKLLRTVAPNIMGQIPKPVLQQVYQNMSADMLLPGFEQGRRREAADRSHECGLQGGRRRPGAGRHNYPCTRWRTAPGMRGQAWVAKSLDVPRPERLPWRQTRYMMLILAPHGGRRQAQGGAQDLLRSCRMVHRRAVHCRGAVSENTAIIIQMLALPGCGGDRRPYGTDSRRACATALARQNHQNTSGPEPATRPARAARRRRRAPALGRGSAPHVRPVGRRSTGLWCNPADGWVGSSLQPAFIPGASTNPK